MTFAPSLFGVYTLWPNVDESQAPIPQNPEIVPNIYPLGKRLEARVSMPYKEVKCQVFMIINFGFSKTQRSAFLNPSWKPFRQFSENCDSRRPFFISRGDAVLTRPKMKWMMFAGNCIIRNSPRGASLSSFIALHCIHARRKPAPLKHSVLFSSIDVQQFAKQLHCVHVHPSKYWPPGAGTANLSHH